MILLVVCLSVQQGGGREKENDRIWRVLKYNASVYEDSTTYYLHTIIQCTISCWRIGKQGNIEKE
jgi:hypothetical protein